MVEGGPSRLGIFFRLHGRAGAQPRLAPPQQHPDVADRVGSGSFALTKLSQERSYPWDPAFAWAQAVSLNVAVARGFGDFFQTPVPCRV